MIISHEPPFASTHHKLRKQTVEPVRGQIESARGFPQFVRRG
jgi:hypothetical protein